MKKLFWMPLAVLAVFALAFVGCGGDDDVAVTGISLDPSSLTLTKGATGTLTATIEPDDATNKNVTWESENVNVVTVVGDGLTATITAVGAGTAKVNVISDANNEKTASCEVTVPGLGLNAYELKLPPDAGYEFEFEAVLVPANAAAAYTWASSAVGVATITVDAEDPSKATLTVVAPGETIITVTSGALSVECEVEVIESTAVPGGGVLFDTGDWVSALEDIAVAEGPGNGPNGEITFYPPLNVKTYSYVELVFNDASCIEWWIQGVARDYFTEEGDEEWFDDITFGGAPPLTFRIPIETVDYLGDISLSGGGSGGGCMEALEKISLGN